MAHPFPLFFLPAIFGVSCVCEIAHFSSRILAVEYALLNSNSLRTEEHHRVRKVVLALLSLICSHTLSSAMLLGEQYVGFTIRTFELFNFSVANERVVSDEICFASF